MSGRSELHVTGSDPVEKCTIELNSEDAWIFIDRMRPSAVADSVLKQIKVEGKSASLNKNVRVVQFGEGTVIIPHPPDYQPLEVFSAKSYMGKSKKLDQYRKYDAGGLGDMNGVISSFILKRGYMATFAENEDGTGHSKCYVAQDFDVEVAALPVELDNRIKFVRVFPWRWTSKKGGANLQNGLNLGWWYNWNLNENSSLDLEYVAIKQKRYWPGLDQDWQKRGINHLLGYNEPDKSDQANMSVDDAIAGWPELLKTGLRVGSPAVTDGGRDRWLYPFLAKCRELNYRVDFIAIHYYWGHDPGDPEGATSTFYNFLKSVHDRTGLPIWITEWNNGANWTNNGDPSFDQQKRAIEAMVKMLDETPWVERYAIYNWVEDCRRVQWDDGSLTEAGEVYRDEVSPIAYQQDMPRGSGKTDAVFLFENNLIDVSGNGNNAKAFGSITYAPMGEGSCLQLNGESGYLMLPPRSSSSGGAFTFAGWVRWAGGDKDQHLFDFGDGKTRGFYLTPQSDSGRMEFVVRNDGDEESFNVKPLKPGAWTHIALTATEDGSELYINGQSVRSSKTVTVSPEDQQTPLNYIGRGQNETDPLFKGQIFEIRFLSKALQPSEVKHLAERVIINFNSQDLKFSASAGNRFERSLAKSAEGGEGTLVFEKTAGPEWLTIQSNGDMSGRPTEADQGVNKFIVTVSDSGGRMDAKEMVIEVR